jgi:hypothetical protein
MKELHYLLPHDVLSMILVLLIYPSNMHLIQEYILESIADFE